ncbi:OmpA family protein [Rhodobacter ferrooxidans]|nr:OmpA family protein [Rhodobacter sp. SW2]
MTQRPFPFPARLIGLTLWLAATPALALTPSFPGPATQTASRTEPLTSTRLPIGAWTAATGLPTRLAEGALEQTAWRIAAPAATPQALSTLALMQPLRAQLAVEGYRVLFECETAACGGFDFRFGAEVLPEPDMHVDLGDFRYVVAERGTPDGPDLVALMVSRSATSGFVQMTRVAPAAAMPVVAADPVPAAEAPAETVDLGNRLETGGSLALDDLVFSSGTAALAEGSYASLQALADYLKAHPDRAIAVVGHTDASGPLAVNIALSRKRAASVRQVLIDSLGVPATQVIAEGVGFLVPRASNLTEAGRAQNRRVEVMLTSTQ